MSATWAVWIPVCLCPTSSSVFDCNDGNGVTFVYEALGNHHRMVNGGTVAYQGLLASWLLLAMGACRDPHAWSTMLLPRLGANEVANRPGRIEPRVLKRRRHRYPLMQRSREQLREQLRNTQPHVIARLMDGRAIRGWPRSSSAGCLSLRPSVTARNRLEFRHDLIEPFDDRIDPEQPSHERHPD